MKIAILSYYHNQVERGVENWADEVQHRFPGEIIIFSANSVGTPFILKVIHYLFVGRFDIVVPTGGRLEAVVVRLLSLFIGYKVLIFGHSGQGWDDRLNLWTFPHTFVSFSAPAAKWAKTVNPFIKVALIPVGIDLNTYQPLGPKVKIDLPRPIIFTNAAAIPSKQIDLTIKAVSKLNNASLLVASNSGSQMEELRNLGNRLLGNRFKMISIPHHQIPSFYRSVQLFTLTSWIHESFPIVYLEAMACNLPVIATDDPIRRAMMGPAGAYVDPHDEKAYTSQLQNALHTNWGNIPRTQAKKYSWDIVIKQYQQLCQGLIS